MRKPDPPEQDPRQSRAPVARDTSHPMRLLDRVDDAQSRIDRLNAMLDHNERLATLGTIAALIAHEFNNLLTPVMSYAQMALERPDDRELCLKALRKSASGAERAAAIATAILGFARDDGGLATGRGVGVGGSDVPRGTSCVCDVRRVVDEALSCLARDLGRDGIRLEVDVEEGLRAGMKAVALQHVVLNLVLNARNAMLPSGGSLRIRARRCGECPEAPAGAVVSDEVPRGTVDGPYRSGGWVEVVMEDTGRGMNNEQITNLFRPFYSSGERGLGAVDRRSGERGDRRGTGLGMTICTRLLAEAGGWMWVTSAEGKGTGVGVVVRGA